MVFILTGRTLEPGTVLGLREMHRSGAEQACHLRASYIFDGLSGSFPET